MVDQVGGRTVVEPAKPPGWGLIAGLVLLALVLGLTAYRNDPPSPDSHGAGMSGSAYADGSPARCRPSGPS